MTIDLSVQEAALGFVQGAFRLIDRPLGAAERVAFWVRIEDAMRAGETEPFRIAWRALERDGWEPVEIGAGAMRFISLAMEPGIPPMAPQIHAQPDPGNDVDDPAADAEAIRGEVDGLIAEMPDVPLEDHVAELERAPDAWDCGSEVALAMAAELRRRIARTSDN